MKWKNWLVRLGQVRLTTLVLWLIRLSVWAGALFTAYQGWIRFDYAGRWPYPGGLPAAIWADLWWFLLFMGLALATLLNGFITKPKSKDAVEDERRSNYQELAIHKMRDHVKALKRDFVQPWELLLLATEVEIEMALGVSGKKLIQANLILVESPVQISVVARTRVGPCPQLYPLDPARMVGRAIAHNVTVVECHVKKVPGFEGKPYDCVAATPIARGDRAFGAISVDSKEPETFKDRTGLVDRILRPYCAIILLTLDQEAKYHPCPHKNTR